jgi:selenocysteine-specific elongation factor
MVMVEERGASGLPLSALTSRAAVPPRAVNETVERLTREGRAVLVGDTLVGPRVLAHLRERLVAELHAHHEKQPLSDGVPREELRARVFGRASAEVFGEVLGGLAAEGRLVARERVALAGHQVSLSPDEQRARDVIERLLRDAGLTPPDQAALRLAAGVAPDLIDRVVALLVRQKVIVRLETLLFHADALERLKADVATLRALGTPPTRIDVSAFKDRYGITRKYAIPLLEYLDRERVTRRLGDSRVVI